MKLITTLFVLLALLISVHEQSRAGSLSANEETPVNYKLYKTTGGKWTLEAIPVSETETYKKTWDKFTEQSMKAKYLDWYVSENPKGEIDGLWAGELKGTPPDQYWSNVPEGTTFTPVELSDLLKTGWLLGVDDTKEDVIKRVEDTLSSAVETAQAQICNFSVLPTTVTLNAEVKVSIGVGGAIGLSMQWNTKELCSD